MKYYKKAVMFVLICLVSSPLAYADQQSAVALFVKGNNAYTEEKYDTAIKLYEQIVASGTVSGQLLYNLGNSYFKEGDLGRAVLNYERALQYIPRNSDLRANYFYALSLMKKTDGAVSKNIPARLFEKFVQFYTVGEISWILVVLFALLAAVHLSSLFFSWRAGRTFAVIAVLGCLFCIYSFGLYVKGQCLKNQAIVLKDTAALFEPREDATTHFMVFEANSVKMIKNQDGWVKIERFDGKTGWAKSDMIEKISTVTKGL